MCSGMETFRALKFDKIFPRSQSRFDYGARIFSHVGTVEVRFAFAWPTFCVLMRLRFAPSRNVATRGETNAVQREKRTGVCT
jgi:hypothetical protein